MMLNSCWICLLWILIVVRDTCYKANFGDRLHQSQNTSLQPSSWPFPFLFRDLTEEPRCLLGAASVNGESKSSMAIVVNQLNENHNISETEGQCSYLDYWSADYLYCSWTVLYGLPLQPDLVAYRSEAGPGVYNLSTLRVENNRSAARKRFWNISSYGLK